MNRQLSFKALALSIALVFFFLPALRCSADRSIRLGSGNMTAAFSRIENGRWGVAISESGSEIASSTQPAAIILLSGTAPDSLSSSYQSIKKEGKAVVASSTIRHGNTRFIFTDRWSAKNGGISMDRTVRVSGDEPDAGYLSRISITLTKTTDWKSCRYLIPGLIYGEPHTSPMSKGGQKYMDAQFFSVREDCLSAPMATIVNPDNSWITLLDPSPDGNTTWAESCAGADDTVIDPSLGFGAMEIRGNGGAISLGFNYPGTTEDFPMRFMGQPSNGNSNAGEVSRPMWRLHPVISGQEQHYCLTLKLGRGSSFPEIQKQTWRWAWQTLGPKVKPLDEDMIEKDLINHLSDRVLSYGGRTGVPFVIDAQSGRPGSFRPAVSNFRSGTHTPEIEDNIKWGRQLGFNIDPSAAELDIWPYAVFGFCGKHMEIAQLFEREADIDATARGNHLRAQAEAIINTFVKYFPLDPPVGEGINLRTGRVGNIHGGSSFSIRPIGEDLNSFLILLEQEEKQGRSHPEWLAWCKTFADWLLPFQREDGSFPADWTDGKISDRSGSKTYGVIPMYMRLGRMTGDEKYTKAALSAAEFMWQNYGTKAVYLGATGGSSVADKESGMLSMDAFLTVYEFTRDKKWLERADAAADYTESWIWIWNVPMPAGADPGLLGWKPGVSTIGVNGIGSNDVGGVDQYLAWAVPDYAKLYRYTGDRHYRDVAYILLHGTKAMLAIDGRTYDLAGPGWQQEHWRMNRTRGIGAHRTWLPWISVNHLHGITALKDFDPGLYRELSRKQAEN